ncbi:hypothetical protein Forpe1208_v010402 [Fusarium oxysporum f. sp. rapae]|uniref:Uncharacterized protein n=1 Tax=Fusarium oxysporum f. sp. rapae TaxID=485398 RepID=A0A8J5NQY4_FUSOX|nr:hypothetical protein Forpe1208_v010402 [Fusarium oxysporum f. sp. rapae]
MIMFYNTVAPEASLRKKGQSGSEIGKRQVRDEVQADNPCLLRILSIHSLILDCGSLGAPTVEGTLLIIAAYEALVQLRKALKIRRGRSLGSKPLLIALAYIEST